MDEHLAGAAIRTGTDRSVLGTDRSLQDLLKNPSETRLEQPKPRLVPLGSMPTFARPTWLLLSSVLLAACPEAATPDGGSREAGVDATTPADVTPQRDAAPDADALGNDGGTPVDPTTPRYSRCASARVRTLARARFDANRGLLERYADSPSGDSGANMYDLAAASKNLLDLALACGDRDLFNELVGIYNRAIPSLETATYDDGSSMHNVTRKRFVSYPTASLVGQEGRLNSAQLTYVLARALHGIAAISATERTAAMNTFVAGYREYLAAFYDFWLFNVFHNYTLTPSCPSDGFGTPARVNFRALLTAQRTHEPDGCNYAMAIDDWALWLIAGGAEILLAFDADATSITLAGPAGLSRATLVDELTAAADLLDHRTARTDLTNFSGQRVVGYVLDPCGDWNSPVTTINNMYSGYEGAEFPISRAGVYMPVQRARCSGWDLSHANRWVQVFNSMREARSHVGYSFFTAQDLERYANQLIYRLYDRNIACPHFSNYVSGANGWFRVNYNGRPGYGYAPSEMSVHFAEGGFSFFGAYNNDINVVANRLLELWLSSNPADVACQQSYQWTDDYVHRPGGFFGSPNHSYTMSFFPSVLAVAP